MWRDDDAVRVVFARLCHSVVRRRVGIGLIGGGNFGEVGLRAVLVTVAVMVRVAFAPALIAPTVQMPVPLAYVPCVCVDETKVIPAGNRSVTTTSVALLTPAALLTMTVNVTFCPTFGEALLTVLSTDRSMLGGVTVAVAVSSSPGVVPLLPGVESTSV